MEKLLCEMHAWMAAYMRSFYTEDEEVQQAIRLKEVHTGIVTSIAVELAKHLGLAAHDVQLAEIMGLFHDVGRFRQFTIYRTFNDAVSEDHAALGLKTLDELPFFSRLAPADEALVRFAIWNHNKKVIAPARASAPTSLRSSSRANRLTTRRSARWTTASSCVSCGSTT